MNHTDSIVEIRNLSFSYEKNIRVLDDITFDIHKGDYLGIIGPNGGGKTTLLRILLGLLTPTSGTITLFGKESAKFHQWHKIAYVPQKATAFDARFPVTVEEVVRMGTFARRGMLRWSTKEDAQKVRHALENVSMESYANAMMSDLSGGQQQRVFIARALAGEPEILFLDEPTVGVDASTQKQFYRLLKKLNTSLQLTLVLVTHELDVVAREATEVACINGKLVCYATPIELKNDATITDLYGGNFTHLRHDQHEHHRIKK